MDSNKQQSTNISETADVNIDINGDPETSGAQVGSSTMKSMNADDNSRVGFTKEELMKFANEPFWIRLRNILFASFWIVWVSILVAAIGYVVNSPSCNVVSASSVSPSGGAAAAANATSTG